jgi:CHAT domain-containing protein
LDLLRLAADVRRDIERRCAGADGTTVAVLEVLDASQAKGRTFQQELMERLTGNDYDVVHFYGHSIAGPGGTFLIAPGEDEFTGYPISIRAVASWIGDLTAPGRRGRLPALVLLSSCQSGSVQTALEMMQAGVETVIGFRWEVEETTAADYVAAFYKAYLGRREHVTESYRFACDQARVLSQGTPGWASAIVLTNDG